MHAGTQPAQGADHMSNVQTHVHYSAEVRASGLETWTCLILARCELVFLRVLGSRFM
jgi:hypothetical protein